MIDYDDLRKKAELAKLSPIGDWVFDDPGNPSQELDRIAIVAGMPAAEFIANVTPGIVLRLLDIIAVAKAAIVSMQDYSSQAQPALDEIAKLEKE